MIDEPFAAISDKASSDQDFARALDQLSDVNEPFSFWRDLANNEEYSKTRRAYFVIELFRRHVTKGITLHRMAQLLEGSTWLHDEDIDVVTAIEGEIPVTWNLEDTVFVIRLFPESERQSSFAIYLRVAGKIPLDSFIRLLRGYQVPESTANAVVLEVGSSEPFKN